MVDNAKKIAGYGKEIYEKAVLFLARHGMLVENEFWRERILSVNGSSSNEQRIFFSEQFIKEKIPFGKESGFKLDTTEDSFHFNAPQANPQDKFRYRVGGFAMSVYDVEQNVVRPSTGKDLEEALMLCEGLNIGGQYPCTATDVHPALRNVAAHKMCFTKSRINSTHVCCGVEQAEIIHRMHQVIGPQAQMPLTLTIVTPFRIEGTNLDVIEHFIKKGVDKSSIRIVPVGYGLSGMNYPITLAGSWALCLAEHMGLYLCAKFLDSGFDIAPAVGPAGLCPVDYQSMYIAGGNPNQLLHTIANNILAHAVLGRDHKDYPEAEVPLWTGSPVPDMQAAVEKFSAVSAACMRGAEMFGRLGNLCIDDVFCAEELFADIEMIDYGSKSISALKNVDEFMDMEGLVEEVDDFVNNDVSFMMAESTLKHLRSIYPGPGAFVHEKLASIQGRGFDSFMKEMNARKKETLGKYNFSLEVEKQVEIEKIYSDAERILVT